VDGNDEIEQSLIRADWARLGADPGRVAGAIRRLRGVRDQREGEAAYHDVLDAIGHNHSGWLYDAAGPAAPILVDIARQTRGWARQATLEILIDCLSWVRPEQQFTNTDGHTKSVQDTLRHAVASYRADLQVPIARSADELLQALHKAEHP
jgi:hypothetical protein